MRTRVGHLAAREAIADSGLCAGQSLLTFVFQFCGFGLGSIVGMIILEIFHYAGGVTYNPYGLVQTLVALGLVLNFD